MHILLIVISLILVPSISNAKYIYFNGVVGDSVAEAVSEQFEKEVDDLNFSMNKYENCEQVLKHGKVLFYKLSQYYDNDSFKLISCRYKENRLKVEYSINRKRMEMFIHEVDPSAGKLFVK